MEENLGDVIYDIITKEYKDKLDLKKDFEDYLKRKKVFELLSLYLLYSFIECSDNIEEKIESLSKKKKEEIIEEIIRFLDNNMSIILSYFNDKRKSDIREISKRDGYCKFVLNQSNVISLDTIKILKQLNFIFCKREQDSVVIHMPEFIKEKVNSVNDDLGENKIYDEIVLYTKGIADTYGKIEIYKAYEIIKRDIDIKFEKYESMIKFITILELESIYFDFKNICNFNIIDEELVKLDGNNTEIVLYDKKFYEDMATDKFMINLSEYQELRKFLKLYFDCDIDEDEILREEIVCAYIDFLQTNEAEARKRLNQSIAMFFEADDFEKLTIIEYLEKIRKRMPNWRLGGRIENYGKILNLSRNDKCYCGSGKKYKNCCGK